VHPPVDVGNLSPTVAETQDHYLALGRLAANKRVAELAARWSDHAGDRQLLIAGDGPKRDCVEAAAGHQIRDGVTGHTFEWRSVSSLIEAVSRLERDGVEWSPTEIAEWATRFGRERFREQIRAVVAEAEDRATVEPELFDDAPEAAAGELIATTDGGISDE